LRIDKGTSLLRHIAIASAVMFQTHLAGVDGLERGPNLYGSTIVAFAWKFERKLTGRGFGRDRPRAAICGHGIFSKAAIVSARVELLSIVNLPQEWQQTHTAN